jgi:hypothetical protein
MSQFTQKEIRAAASAIANARGNRRGVPTVTNILEMLPKKLFDEVMEDAQTALDAAAAAHTKVFSGSIDALKEVARLQTANCDLLAFAHAYRGSLGDGRECDLKVGEIVLLNMADAAIAKAEAA